jgi:capsular polysaccharide biosynthesis protein
VEKDYQTEIDLGTLFKMLLSRWYIIVISTILGFGIAFMFACMMLDDEYTARTSMIVLVSNEQQSNEQNFNFSQKLTKTYTELAKSDLVISRVKEELGLNVSNDRLREMMTISGVQDTPVIKLAVVAKDKVEAKEIANKTVLVMQEVSLNFDGFDNIEILDVATTPENPSGPNRLLYVVIGVLLGGIVGVGIVFMIELFDKKLKSPLDIERKLGLRLLAIIPDYTMEEEIEKL